VYPDLAKLRARELLIRTRTKLVNAVRGIVKATGARLASCTTRTFAKKMADELPDELKDALRPLIETIAYVNEQITAYDEEIEAVAKRGYPETEKLRAVHGVGPVTRVAVRPDDRRTWPVCEVAPSRKLSWVATEAESIGRAMSTAWDHKSR
jgi:transposase